MPKIHSRLKWLTIAAGHVVFFHNEPAKRSSCCTSCKRWIRGVTVRQNMIILCEGNAKFRSYRSTVFRLLMAGVSDSQVENTLAAVAAAWSTGWSREVIRAGLETFATDIKTSPGRFNLLEYNGATVIVDTVITHRLSKR